MKNSITFRPIVSSAENLIDKPVPAKKIIPQWFKDVPLFEDPKQRELPVMTMKGCMPFFDTFVSGYIQTLWTDVYIDVNYDPPSWGIPLEPAAIGIRENQPNRYPKIENFCNYEFSWKQYWIPELPKGYSMLYTHPFNRYDLPFLSLSGIVDNDEYYMERSANHPFFIREGFSGIIPRGTPIFQMIPIKRDSWKSIFKKYEEEISKNFLSVRKTFNKGYKKLYWQKKEYN